MFPEAAPACYGVMVGMEDYCHSGVGIDEFSLSVGECVPCDSVRDCDAPCVTMSGTVCID